MKPTERNIYFYDLLPKAGSPTLENPKPLSLEKMLELLGGLTDAQRKQSRSNSQRTYAVSDWKSHGNRVAFLFRMSDRSIADPFFSDLDADARRKAQKILREGHDFSSHILIELPANPVDPAVMLMERTPGITLPRVMVVLKLLLRKARPSAKNLFLQPSVDGALDDDGNPILHKINYWIDAEGHISQKLADDLNHGAISQVELITNRHREEPFDHDAYLVNDEEVITLKVNKKYKGLKDKFKKVTQIFEDRKGEYEKARIKFTTATGTAGLIKWDADYGISDQYLRKEIIRNIDPPMESSYASCRDDVLTRMSLLLK